MRIIKRTTLHAYGQEHPDARTALERWAQIARSAAWRNLAEARRIFPQADQVKVKSGGVVTIFNLKGNHYRLITAIHYNRAIIYILRFYTHTDYDQTNWKEML